MHELDYKIKTNKHSNIQEFVIYWHICREVNIVQIISL